MTVLIEIQAPHVGMGKSTFCERLAKVTPNSVFVDDSCMDFRSILNQNILSGNLHDDLLAKAYLMLADQLRRIQHVVDTLKPKYIFTSRSAVISAIQFLSESRRHYSIHSMIGFYRACLENCIEYTFVLDYGTVVRDYQQAYNRMLWRGRHSDSQRFQSLKEYVNFVEQCEFEKNSIVQVLQLVPRLQYVEIENFYGFDEMDAQIVWELIGVFKHSIKRYLNPLDEMQRYTCLFTDLMNTDNHSGMQLFKNEIMRQNQAKISAVENESPESPPQSEPTVDDILD